jgi:DNA gyrase/topoisomerase IV subunit A
MATASGTVKKTALTAYSNQRANGIIALNLRDDDTLIGVDITDGTNDIMLFSDAGKVVRFNEKVRDSETGEIKLDPETGEERWALKPIGRTGTGVRGIKLELGLFFDVKNPKMVGNYSLGPSVLCLHPLDVTVRLETRCNVAKLVGQING